VAVRECGGPDERRHRCTGDQLPALVTTLRNVRASTIERVVLQPPDFATAATGPNGAYILIPDLEAIRAVGERLLLP